MGRSATTEIANTAEQIEQPLREQAGRVVEEVKELGTVAASASGELIDTAKTKGQEALVATRREGRKAREHVEDYVREHPLGAIAWAAGAGAALAMILRK